MLELIGTHYSYFAYVALVGIGLYAVIESSNLVKKLIGLNIFQVGIFLFFITGGYITGGVPPRVAEGGGPYVSPLPQVLILTAIVVGVSLTAVGLALIVRIYEEYGTLDEKVLSEAQINE